MAEETLSAEERRAIADKIVHPGAPEAARKAAFVLATASRLA